MFSSTSPIVLSSRTSAACDGRTRDKMRRFSVWFYREGLFPVISQSLWTFIHHSLYFTLLDANCDTPALRVFKYFNCLREPCATAVNCVDEGVKSAGGITITNVLLFLERCYASVSFTSVHRVSPLHVESPTPTPRGRRASPSEKPPLWRNSSLRLLSAIKQPRFPLSRSRKASGKKNKNKKTT